MSGLHQIQLHNLGSLKDVGFTVPKNSWSRFNIDYFLTLGQEPVPDDTLACVKVGGVEGA